MRRSILCLALAVIVLGAARAGAEERANSLRDDMWALQFSVDGFFNSGGVHLKRHFSAKNALRIGFVGSGSSSEGDRVNVDSTMSDIAADYYSIYTELVFEHYVRPVAPANFYWGIGPFVESSHRHDESADELRHDVADQDELEVGLVGMIGAEWFASESFNLHIEYTASLGYQTLEYERRFQQPGMPEQRVSYERDEWSVDAGRTVRFGVGMYF